jgi:thymidylate synthase ThyX
MSGIGELKHAERKLENGGQVIVLNTGALIDPEAEAMLQALHSRSTGGLKEHLDKLIEKGAEKFMASFYVGYGHKSIGDCGSVTIFIEGVSMLAAKAVQDWPLYSGQESSTRYIDFSKQLFINPSNNEQGTDVLESWRSFYLASMNPLQAYLKQQNPIQAGEKESIYDKAIAARAFDILRGFLPAGASTNLAWHTNLRQAADHIMQLRHHPLAEVKDLAEAMEEALVEAYGSSFGHKRYEGTETYNAQLMQNMYFDHEPYTDVELLQNNIDKTQLAEYKEALQNRPDKTELPKWLSECGTLQFGFMLDFGSFRDLQRHRAITQRMPLLTNKHSFANFYLESLPVEIRTNAEELLTSQSEKIEALKLDPETEQYYHAMGYELPNRITGSLPALVYLVELRATRFVHPTLRVKAARIAELLRDNFAGDGLVLHMDKEPDRFDIKRGEHDIVQSA